MKQSHLFGTTQKSIAADEVSSNAQLLMRAGFVNKEMAGVFSYLPLGLRVIRRIEGIIREEMEREGAQELLMPALNPKENWEKTGRWDGLDVLFKLKSGTDKEYALGATHEEIVTPLARTQLKSYRDFPRAVYQIQNKFRDEPRAKSGLLRGREFIMKDLYSFHTTETDLDTYYDQMRRAYARVYERVGVKAYEVAASGGTFSKFSHEYQVFTDAGEDLVYHCDRECGYAVNKEIMTVDEGGVCPECGQGKVLVTKAIEVGNIFKLKNKYSDAFDYTFTDADGTNKPVLMGCYGIGVTRLLGTIVEVHHDERGIIWPASVAPFAVHIVSLGTDEQVMTAAQTVYESLQTAGVSVLFDDRGLSAGAALADADLIGIPLRIVISTRSLAAGGAEMKARTSTDSKIVPLEEIVSSISG